MMADRQLTYQIAQFEHHVLRWANKVIEIYLLCLMEIYLLCTEVHYIDLHSANCW